MDRAQDSFSCMQTNRLAALTINFDPCDAKPIYLEENENSHYPICYFENK